MQFQLSIRRWVPLVALAGGWGVAWGLTPTGKSCFQAWLEREAIYNASHFRQHPGPIKIGVVGVPRSQVTVWIGDGAPAALIQSLTEGNTVPFPQHPFNSAESVPYAGLPPDQYWTGYHTASRSIVIDEATQGIEAVSVKLPTNRVHGGLSAPDKVEMADDIAAGMQISRHIAETDSKIKRPTLEVQVLKEVAAVMDKNGEGVLYRDLSPLKDGNQIVPGFSIPHLGPDFVAKSGKGFDPFWKEAYAVEAGKAKAKLLLKYGLQMESAHPQNLLTRLKPDFSPAGVAIRDVSDMEYVEFIVKAMGKGDLLKEAKKLQRIASELDPNSRFLTYGFSPTPEMQSLAKEWQNASTNAYVDTIVGELGLSRVMKPYGSGTPEMKLMLLNKYLKSEAGRRRLVAYYKSIGMRP